MKGKGSKTVVTVRQDGQMPSPIVLKVEFASDGPKLEKMRNAKILEDGSAIVTWPVDVWFAGKRTFDAKLKFGARQIEKITLDRAGRFPDRSKADNVWPYRLRLDRRPMLTARAGRDEQDPARLADENAMPDTARNDDRLARRDVDDAFRLLFFQDNRYAPGDEIQDLISIGVHFATVRRIAGHLGYADRQPVDGGWLATIVSSELRLPATTYGDKEFAQIERGSRLISHRVSRGCEGCCANDARA